LESQFDVPEHKGKIPAIKEIDQNSRHAGYFKPGSAGPQKPVQQSSQQTIPAKGDYKQKGAKEYNNFLKEEVKVPHSHHQPTSKSIRKRTDDSSEEENFEEPEAQRAIPQFLMNLPGVTATDSMGYRIEALRLYLETQLGDIPFIAAYKHLVVRVHDNLVELVSGG
jgi:hypothetical protein